MSAMDELGVRVLALKERVERAEKELESIRDERLAISKIIEKAFRQRREAKHG